VHLLDLLCELLINAQT